MKLLNRLIMVLITGTSLLLNTAVIADEASQLSKIDAGEEKLLNLFAAENAKAKKRELQKQASVKKEIAKVILDISIEVDLSEQTMKVLQGDVVLYDWVIVTNSSTQDELVGNHSPEFFKEKHLNNKTQKKIMLYAIFFTETNAIVAVKSKSGITLQLKNAKILFELVQKVGKEHCTITIVA